MRVDKLIRLYETPTKKIRRKDTTFTENSEDNSDVGERCRLTWHSLPPINHLLGPLRGPAARPRPR